MASRRLGRMGLPPDICSRLASRGLHTAGDVLFRSDLDLVHLLDLPLGKVRSTRAHVSHVICPPSCTVKDILVASVEAGTTVRLPTQLPALDTALGGGLPCGCITEIVGPAGMGKSQLCLTLALMAVLPAAMGGLDGRVVLFDTEKKFSVKRLLEIARHRFSAELATGLSPMQLVERVVVITPASTADLIQRLESLQIMMVRDGVRLIVLDSVAAMLRTDSRQAGPRVRQEQLGRLAAMLKDIAEGHGVPVVVTNQVSGAGSGWGSGRGTSDAAARPSDGDGAEARSLLSGPGGGGVGDAGWSAALGIKWAHSVNVRLAIHDSPAPGFRVLQIAKAPMAPPLLVQVAVTAAGLVEVEPEDGMEMAHP